MTRKVRTWVPIGKFRSNRRKEKLSSISRIWIGFDVVANRQALCSEIAEIKDMVDLTEKDITELQELYAKRTQNAGRMYFGLQRTK